MLIKPQHVSVTQDHLQGVCQIKGKHNFCIRKKNIMYPNRSIIHLQRTTSKQQSSNPSQSQVKVTLRLTVSQSISLGVEPHLRLMTRYLLFFDSYGLVILWRPL
jgi:hypothetical protein